MKICLGQANAPDFPQGAAVTIGNFDGVHLGHKHILQKLKHEADLRGLPVAVVIFEPQPKEFFARRPVKNCPTASARCAPNCACCAKLAASMPFGFCVSTRALPT